MKKLFLFIARVTRAFGIFTETVRSLCGFAANADDVEKAENNKNDKNKSGISAEAFGIIRFGLIVTALCEIAALAVLFASRCAGGAADAYTLHELARGLFGSGLRIAVIACGAALLCDIQARRGGL